MHQIQFIREIRHFPQSHFGIFRLSGNALRNLFHRGVDAVHGIYHRARGRCHALRRLTDRSDKSDDILHQLV